MQANETIVQRWRKKHKASFGYMYSVAPVETQIHEALRSEQENNSNTTWTLGSVVNAVRNINNQL